MHPICLAVFHEVIHNNVFFQKLLGRRNFMAINMLSALASVSVSFHLHRPGHGNAVDGGRSELSLVVSVSAGGVSSDIDIAWALLPKTKN